MKDNKLIVLDSNIWIANPLLKTPLASALLYGIVLSDAKIGLPEIVEREILHHTVKKGKQLLSEFFGKASQLALYINAKQMHMPLLDYNIFSDAISCALKDRLLELEKHILRHSHTMNEYQSAIDMLLDYQPPNSKQNQQFKDSLLWRSIIEMSKQHYIYFITSDTGFFTNRDYHQGIVANIQDDILNTRNNIEIHSSIDSCIDLLEKSNIAFNIDEICSNIFFSIKQEISNYLATHGFYPKELIEKKITFYVTSDKDKIAAKYDFDITLGAVYPQGDECVAKSFVSGILFVSPSDSALSNVSLLALGWKSSKEQQTQTIPISWPNDVPVIYCEMQQYVNKDM